MKKFIGSGLCIGWLILAAGCTEQSEAQEPYLRDVAIKEISIEAAAFLNKDGRGGTAAEIQDLKDLAMEYYLHGGDLERAADFFDGASFSGKYDVVEKAFETAAHLDPLDLDLQFSMASAQAAKMEIPKALETYDQILSQNADYFEARLMAAVYAELIEDQQAYMLHMDELKALDREKALKYQASLERANKLLEVQMNTDVPEELDAEAHAFVVLGYALSTDGEMEEPLVERLKVAKEAASSFEDSKLIVTGGIPVNGITESDLMYEWLVENGIDEDRIFKESMATDTIENALLSVAIADEEGIENMTVVTSASHLRRAVVLFDEASRKLGEAQGRETDREFESLVYLDYESIEEAQEISEKEKLIIYRDLMRLDGVWAYPGLQR